MDRLLAGLSSAQFTEWLAYAELEPFGPLEDSKRAGMVAAVTANSAFGREKGSRTFVPEDFFPALRQAKAPGKQQTWQSMQTTLKAATSAMGGKVMKRGERLSAPEKKNHPVVKTPKRRSGDKK